MDEHAIFAAAMEQDGEAAREAWLREACGADERMRERVTRLLKLHAEADDFLEQPVLPAEMTGAVTEGPGSMIGAYKLLEQIGEGGMGVVYMAAQQEPVRRKVAVKIIKPGMDTKQVIARFEAERQALALMEHENIARVLDAGATDSGRPYFVMELVRGIPVTDYCQHERLEPAQRLRLFTDVCRAVQHAHQKGIIHRDIKPSNVMITLHDGEPIVKMIDFGVAKATNQQLTDRTLFTNYAQMIGTPLYMSPEQAEMSGLDVDTRSDIYSLGVLLYELLTDTTPFERERLKAVNYDEMRRIICEEEPPKPSTRLSTLGLALETVSDQRRADARRISEMLRGELDWIVVKALDKNRMRRYQTAKDFADDVQRYLDGEPVQACPPSIAYRARKLLVKYRGIAAAVFTIGLLLVVASVVAISLAIRATRAERRAELAQATAEREAAIATAISEFLSKELLGEASPYENPNRDLRLREVLDRAAERIDGPFVGQPLVEAEIRVTLGKTYHHLGEYKESAAHFKRAHQIYAAELGERHPRTLRIASREAFYARKTAGAEASAAALAETLELQDTVLPMEHPDTLLTKAWLAWTYVVLSRFDEAQALFDQAIPAMKRVLGPEHPDTLDCLDSLARMYADQERHAEAEQLHRQNLAARRRVLGEDHPQTLDSLSALADLKMLAGQAEQALDIYDQVAHRRRRVQGEQHPSTLANERDAAEALRKSHRLEAAERRYLEALEAHRQRYDEDHRQTRYTARLLATLYETQGRYAEALPLREAVLESQRRTLGNNDKHTIVAIHFLANVYMSLKQFDKAEQLHQEMVDRRISLFGENDPRTLHALVWLAYVHQRAKQRQEAERVLEKLAEHQQQMLAAEDAETLYCVLRLGFVYKDLGQPAEAEQYLLRAWIAGQRVWGPRDLRTLEAGTHLVNSLRRQNRLDEAEQLCLEVLAKKTSGFGEYHLGTVFSLTNLAAIYRLQGRLDEAAEVADRIVRIRRKVQGDGHPRLFIAIRRLANLIPLYERRQDAASAASTRELVCDHALEILQSQRERHGDQSEQTLATMQRVAAVLARQGRHDQECELRQKIVAARKQLHGPDDQRTLDAARRLANCQERLRRSNGDAGC